MKKIKFALVIALFFPLFLNAQTADSKYVKELKRISETDYSKIAGKLTAEIKAKGYKIETGTPITKEISFIISNHKDIKSGWPVYLSYRKNEHPNTTVSVTGFVKFYNPDWIDNPKSILRNGMNDPGIMTSFINPKITINGTVLNKAEAKAKIQVQARNSKIEIIQD